MREMRRFFTTRNIVITSLLFMMIVEVMVIYNPYMRYFGFVQMMELEENNQEYAITLSGDFGTRSTVLDEDQPLTIVENDEPRDDHIESIWHHLSEGETYHVLVDVHNKRDLIKLERIYIDYD